jgi:hypothetical protein
VVHSTVINVSQGVLDVQENGWWTHPSTGARSKPFTVASGNIAATSEIQAPASELRAQPAHHSQEIEMQGQT